MLSIWLSTELKRRGWSIRELARRSKISHSWISNVINGHTQPTYDFCVAIGRGFGIDKTEVFRKAGFEHSSVAAVADEHELLADYRNLDQSGRREARAIIRALREAKET